MPGLFAAVMGSSPPSYEASTYVFFGFILIIFCYLFSVAGRYQIQISDQTRFWIQETQEQPSESTVCDAKMEGIHFYIFGFMFGSHWFVFETTLL